MNCNIRQHISNVIDKLGMEKLVQLVELSVEVKTAMAESFSEPPHPMQLHPSIRQ